MRKSSIKNHGYPQCSGGASPAPLHKENITRPRRALVAKRVRLSRCKSALRYTGATGLRFFRGSTRRGFGFFHELREAGGVLDGNVRENLAVERHTGGFQAMDQLAVA